MKLSEINSVATPVQVRDRHGVVIFNEPTAIYTPKEMIEFAEANCWELINWYVESTGDVNHAVEMKIWMDDEFGGHEK